MVPWAQQINVILVMQPVNADSILEYLTAFSRESPGMVWGHVTPGYTPSMNWRAISIPLPCLVHQHYASRLYTFEYPKHRLMQDPKTAADTHSLLCSTYPWIVDDSPITQVILDGGGSIASPGVCPTHSQVG